MLGKFMPPHSGHVYLADFARRFAGRLTILVCSLKREPIPGELRFSWMRELFPDCDVVHVADELPQEPSEHPGFWSIWRDVMLRSTDRPIDYVFASEPYGEPLAATIGAKFIPVDINRLNVPISGTAVRENPIANWQHIPACVRPYFVKRICLFGPESTGKSVFARRLAERFETVHVSEFARELLNLKNGKCDADDIPLIARGQAASEEAMARQANRILFCDTDLLTTTIWSDVFFGDCPQWIRDEAERRQYSLYLLLKSDVEWVDDGQRYFPNDRRTFFERCVQSLESRGRRYVLIDGRDWESRFEKACAAVSEFCDD